MAKLDTILVLDYGSQYNLLIVRRLRELGYLAELVPWNSSELVEGDHVRGVILSGGPASVHDPEAPGLDKAILKSGKPILGICYGMQLLTHELGGSVVQSNIREFGPAICHHDRPGHALLESIPREFNIWMSHGDQVAQLPEGFFLLGTSGEVPAIIAHEESPIFGVQFHPEVTHSEFGSVLLDNFCQICHSEKSWSSQSFILQSVEDIRRQVGAGEAFCALSGGVDSTVAAVLVHRALKDKLHCLFVDHGLLRKDEADEVMKTMLELDLPVVMLDRREEFAKALSGVVDPEQKRKIIGHQFIQAFEEQLSQHPDVRFLVQGTLYPDLVESGAGGHGEGATIKSHHNVGGLPEHMKLNLIEPVKLLFKDEVRALGRELEIPERVLMRQPFPGPGLAVRIMGEVTPERVSILQEADAIVREVLDGLEPAKRPWQYFCVLPGVSTVGVQGDNRTYGELIVIRAVHSEDAMTATASSLPWSLLQDLAVRIVNEVEPVNRVAYDVTPKPPGTIEWE